MTLTLYVESILFHVNFKFKFIQGSLSKNIHCFKLAIKIILNEHISSIEDFPSAVVGAEELITIQVHRKNFYLIHNLGH